uniref:Cytochrome c biogenesis protein Ccs1 n=1 Tax=Symphyocladiella dendroidea TaxID=2506487 RepID=A0A1Z1M7E5_9FLOR|nr:cytochrome c biogenesis protein ccs1 [Symphyocladiella dendroidea]ARW61803.1 cytochrome c biogenesis protein ccs1 [Symphyocladiella dendroidea]
MSKNVIWKSLKKLANLNVAIFVLLMIIFCCILGSIIEQDKSFSYYQFNYPNYYLLIIVLGLDHVFRTWWFILISIIFILSLLVCTFSTQLPSLKNARRWKFVYKKSVFNTNQYYLNNIDDYDYSFTNIIYSLIRLNFFVFSKNNSLYSYKGLYGRIAPVFVHLSITAILLGSVCSFLLSFVVQEIVPIGEVFHLKNIIHSGFYSYLPSDMIFRVNDFYINYNLNGSIQQFFSSLSVYFHNYQLLSSKIISVNKPLRFFSVTFYQTDWQVDAVRINVGESYFVQKKLVKTDINGKNCWLSSISLDRTGKIFFVIFNLDDHLLVCNSEGVILQEVDVGEKFYINNSSFIIKDIITSTGLQVKVDPGIFVVYFGFFIMILSTFISYSSYSQVWIYSSVESLEFCGSTNRAALFFEQDIIYLDKMYSYYLVHINEQTITIYNILI